MLHIFAKEHNIEQKASGSVIVDWINPNQLWGASWLWEEWWWWWRVRQNEERQFLSFFWDWDWLDHLRNVWRQYRTYCNHPVFMRILKYRIRNEWWKCQILKLKCAKKVWGDLWLMRKRVNANNGRWKCIYLIHSSMCIKKIMWLCGVGRQNLANQRTDVIHSIWNVVMVVLKCLSKVCRQSISV